MYFISHLLHSLVRIFEDLLIKLNNEGGSSLFYIKNQTSTSASITALRLLHVCKRDRTIHVIEHLSHSPCPWWQLCLYMLQVVWNNLLCLRLLSTPQTVLPVLWQYFDLQHQCSMMTFEWPFSKRVVDLLVVLLVRFLVLALKKMFKDT